MNLDRIIAVRTNKTIYRDGTRCLKVFNEDFTKADVLNEALNQARVEETGLRIPAILEVTQIDGKWTIISEYIKGKTITQLAHEQPEKVEEYLHMLVDLQIGIHERSCRELTSLRESIRLKICMTDLPATLRYSLHSRLEEMPRRSNICHGDFYPTNVIIMEDGTPCIIDWSHVSQGNPAADVAHTYLMLRFHSGEIPFDAEKYLSLYCQKTGTEAEEVRRWLPIAAADALPDSNAERREFLYPFIDRTLA